MTSKAERKLGANVIDLPQGRLTPQDLIRHFTNEVEACVEAVRLKRGETVVFETRLRCGHGCEDLEICVEAYAIPRRQHTETELGHWHVAVFKKKAVFCQSGNDDNMVAVPLKCETQEEREKEALGKFRVFLERRIQADQEVLDLLGPKASP